MKKQSLYFLIVILSMTMLGCVNQPHPPSQPRSAETKTQPIPEPATTQPQPVPTAPAPVIAPPVAPVINSAVESLIKQARAQYLSRDYQNAIATAERGLRIDRRAADLYLVLAQSYIQLALPQKANMFVQQGLRYAQQGSSVAEGLLRVQEIVRQGN
jgi:tetratricopeptide (TPR) repeat protein